MTRFCASLLHQHRDRRREGGQAVVMIAALLAVLGGMAAMAVDLSSYVADRRALQNDADAIALAASLDLPNSAAARASADVWAEKNNIEAGEIESVDVIAQSLPSEPNPKVRVTLAHDHSFTFARFLGISSAEVRVSAAAIKTSASGGDGMIPLSVTETALNGVTLGDQVTLKYDANNITQGNTSPIRIDGPGTSNCTSGGRYCDGLMHGTANVICAVGSDPTYCTGPTGVDTQTGNVLGATRTAIRCRLYDSTESGWPGTNPCGQVYTDDECDEFDEVMEDDPTTNEQGVYRMTQACNPFISTTYHSNRVLIVPVISGVCNGSCTVTVTDLALFFLEGFRQGTNCQSGNACEVVGRFVRVNQNIGLLAGTFDPESANTFVRLVE